MPDAMPISHEDLELSKRTMLQADPDLLESIVLHLESLPITIKPIPPMLRGFTGLENLKGREFLIIEDNPILLSQYSIATTVVSGVQATALYSSGCDPDLFVSRHTETLSSASAGAVILVDRDIGGDKSLGPRIIERIKKREVVNNSTMIIGFSCAPDANECFLKVGAHGSVVKHIHHHHATMLAVARVVEKLEIEKETNLNTPFFWSEDPPSSPSASNIYIRSSLNFSEKRHRSSNVTKERLESSV